VIFFTNASFFRVFRPSALNSPLFFAAFATLPLSKPASPPYLGGYRASPVLKNGDVSHTPKETLSGVASPFFPSSFSFPRPLLLPPLSACFPFLSFPPVLPTLLLANSFRTHTLTSSGISQLRAVATDFRPSSPGRWILKRGFRQFWTKNPFPLGPFPGSSGDRGRFQQSKKYLFGPPVFVPLNVFPCTHNPSN